MIDTGAFAQEIVHFEPLRGEVYFQFDGLRIQRKNSPTATEYSFEERLSVGSGGYILHPGILDFSAEITPSFFQERFKSDDFNERSNARSLDYRGNAGFFRTKPVSLEVAGMRNSGTTNVNIGNTRKFQSDTYSVGANFSNAYFPSSLNYSRRTLEQTEVSGLSSAVFDIDEVEDRLFFSGRSSKMSLFLERNWFEDLEDDRDLKTDKASLSHQLIRWGKGSRLFYSIDYQDREGFLPSRRFETSEGLHLQHTNNLYTTYSHKYTSLTRNRDTKSHSGDFSLNHRLYQNLNTRMNLIGSTVDSEVEKHESYGGGLSLAYAKKLPRRGRLTAGVGGGYRIDDIESRDGTADVIGETHQVNAAGVFTLDRPLADLSSVVVSDAAGTVVYIEGQDYELQPFGNRVQVVVLPGGRINSGDTLRVDYLVDTLPSRRFSTTSYNYSTGLDFGWVSLYHSASRSDQDLISGATLQPLVRTEDTVTGATFTYSIPDTRATVNAEKRSTKFGDFESDTISLKQSLSHSFSWRTVASLKASQIFYDAGRTEFVTYRGDLLVNLRPKANVFLDLHAGMWQRDEDRNLEQRFMEADSALRWFIGRVELYAKYSHQRWDGDFGERNEDRVTLTFRRKF